MRPQDTGDAAVIKTHSSMTRVCCLYCSHAKSRWYTFQNIWPNEDIGWFDFSQREQNNYCMTDRKISLLWNKRWINAAFSWPASAEMKTNTIYRFANRNWTKGWRSSNFSSTKKCVNQPKTKEKQKKNKSGADSSSTCIFNAFNHSADCLFQSDLQLNEITIPLVKRQMVKLLLVHWCKT